MTNSLQEYNSFDSDLKAHSSALTNERISALISLYDEAIINAKLDYRIEMSEKALVYLEEVWKSFRPLVRSNAFCRKDLRLDTIVDGVYLPDAELRDIDDAIMALKNGKIPETIGNLKILNRKIEAIEIVIRDVIQFFKFTFRPDSRTKPDIHEATEMMHESIDRRTEEELLAIVGVNNHVKWSDFANQKIFERQRN